MFSLVREKLESKLLVRFRATGWDTGHKTHHTPKQAQSILISSNKIISSESIMSGTRFYYRGWGLLWRALEELLPVAITLHSKTLRVVSVKFWELWFSQGAGRVVKTLQKTLTVFSQGL